MYRRILVPIDGSDAGQQGLKEAIALAAATDASLVVLNVLDDFPLLLEISSIASYEETMKNLRKYGEDLLELARTTARDAGVQAETRLRGSTPGRIADVIVDEAAKSDCGLVVMGTHGRRGLSRVALGSDAEEVVRIATTPVLLVRHGPAKG